MKQVEGNVRKRDIRILLTNEWGGVGGAENTVACMAECLEKFGKVTVMHGKPEFTREICAVRFGIELENTEFSLSWPPEPVWAKFRNPLRRISATKAIFKQYSAGTDIFVAVTHFFPPFAFGRLNILHMLFPFDSPESKAMVYGPDGEKHSTRLSPLKALFHRWDVAERLKSYDLLTSNSVFSKEWAHRRWDGASDWDVWYPPVTLHSVGEGKDPGAILAVGRMCADKHPVVGVETFKRLALEQPGSSLTLAGARVSTDRQHEEALMAAGQGVDLRIETDLPGAELVKLYQKASVFWHMMGWGVREDRPESCEHFGMTTVEAMSAGCVPVVYGKGGQVEVVEHGVNGFVWHTPEELLQFTRALFSDPELKCRMSEAAVVSARRFSKAVFQERLMKAVEKRFGDVAPEKTELSYV